MTKNRTSSVDHLFGMPGLRRSRAHDLLHLLEARIGIHAVVEWRADTPLLSLREKNVENIILDAEKSLVGYVSLCFILLHALLHFMLPSTIFVRSGAKSPENFDKSVKFNKSID